MQIQDAQAQELPVSHLGPGGASTDGKLGSPLTSEVGKLRRGLCAIGKRTQAGERSPYLTPATALYDRPGDDEKRAAAKRLRI